MVYGIGLTLIHPLRVVSAFMWGFQRLLCFTYTNISIMMLVTALPIYRALWQIVRGEIGDTDICECRSTCYAALDN